MMHFRNEETRQAINALFQASHPKRKGILRKIFVGAGVTIVYIPRRSGA